ncbi:amidohydrolase family protein [Nocardia sp. SYP-A9097]|uniref:N-acetylglucosamine-6-phosphate deacetylase n=1 Tax=Nocardia sp. SYP-A9097 TaxID=2663237 RepID=UPI00129A5E0D|nr:amidohydrolase family protein [Nocardia sp. SYP-A9097]MRH87216.1 amidohydrolase family protein [Nocardia sp. SYP-A9097]
MSRSSRSRTRRNAEAQGETGGAAGGPDFGVDAGVHIRGRIFSPSHVVEDGVVSVLGERIIAVRTNEQWAVTHPGSGELPFEGMLLPGLVDIHVHGGAGHRFDTVDQADAIGAAEYHRSRGSTTVLAGIVTAAPEDMLAQAAALRELAESGVIGGIYTEGPFLSESRCGAQDPRYLADPDPKFTLRLIEAAGGHLRIMTLAPERDGFEPVARLLTEHGVTVSLGHTDAEFGVFRDAMRPNGFASSVAHLANGMPPMHHRAAGPVAAAVAAAARGYATVELIGDGVHVDSGFGALVFAAAPDRVALITDAMAAAGMPDGSYHLGPQEVQVSGGIARVASGSIAGGTAHLLQCLAWAVRECDVSLADSVRAATMTPALTAGLTDIGDIRPGGFADLIAVDEDFGLRRVLHRGKWLS